MGAAMNKFGKRMGCRERMTHVSLMSPMGLIWTFELSQKLGGYLSTPLGGALTQGVVQINAFLTDINASMTEFNGLCNARKPNV
jgi:hypothetical protein